MFEIKYEIMYSIQIQQRQNGLSDFVVEDLKWAYGNGLGMKGKDIIEVWGKNPRPRQKRVRFEPGSSRLLATIAIQWTPRSPISTLYINLKMNSVPPSLAVRQHYQFLEIASMYIPPIYQEFQQRGIYPALSFHLINSKVVFSLKSFWEA